MTKLFQLFRKLARLRRGRQLESRLTREIEFHLDMKRRDYELDGHDAESADRMARRDVGNASRIIEESRDVWRVRWAEQLIQDLRYGARTLWRDAGFAVIVVLTLALAIGMNTAVFSVIHAVLLRPLSYPDANRLLWVTSIQPQRNAEFVTLPDFLDWQEQSVSFEQMIAYWTNDQPVIGPDHATNARIAAMSDGFWNMSRARPAFGRLPQPGEKEAIVLSHAFFERSFRGDSGIVGKALRMGTRQMNVVGIMDRSFRFEFPTQTLEGHARQIDAYIPMQISPSDSVRGNGIGAAPNVVAKMKPGVSVDAARAELAAIRTRNTQGAPALWNSQELRVQPLSERIVGRQTQLALTILFAAAVFVLLIACANIANLLLARASTRQREIAVRASLGAGRSRVLRQCLTEAAMLALVGGAAGLLFARGGIEVIVRLVPQAVPRLAETAIDGPVLLFAAGASLVTSFLFGLAPLSFVWKVDLHLVLKDGARTASAAYGSLRIRKLLVASELALAVALLTGAGLMVKSFWRMSSYPESFQPERILTLTVGLTGERYYEDPPRQRAFVEEALRAIQSMPGVDAASVMNRELLSGTWEGEPPVPEDQRLLTMCSGVSEQYAEIMGMRLLRGRWFTDSEPARAIVINESLARRDFAGRDPIGRRLRWKGTNGTVVGVVADLKTSRLDAAAEPEFYAHYNYQRRLYSTTLAARLSGDPVQAGPAILKTIAGIDRWEPVYDVLTLDQRLADTIAPRRFNLFLLGAFASAALLLALIGIYGVIAYSVAQRTQEIGVRMALGARRREVTAMVVRQGMSVALAGIAVGLLAASGLTRLMQTMLYDVKPNDAATFAIVAASLIVTALLACCLPAVRAARVDPLVSLRHE
jgi:putative ABC transport system permease protein